MSTKTSPESTQSTVQRDSALHLILHSSFSPAKSEPKTLVEGAYHALRRDIINGVHPPSSKLRVEHLKDRYEVGAGTLREALALLVADSLVYTEGQKGFTVSPVSLDDFADITRLRVMLETQALSQSIENGGDEWEANVISAYHRLTLSEKKFAGKASRVEPTVFEEWEERNEKFHAALVSACRSPWLLQFIGILYHHSERYRRIGLRHTQGKNRDIHAEHEALKNAALQRDIKLSTEILSHHISMTYELISKLPESVFQNPILPAAKAGRA